MSMKKKCALCDKAVFCRDWCTTHYSRWLKRGDPNATVRHYATHGMTNVPEYQVWAGMKQRCENPANDMYRHYGGRGIAVCTSWQDSFEAFYRDMGPRPSPKHSIDRIDNNGPYSPENCRWATALEQGNNQRRPWRDKTHCIRGHEFTPENTYITKAGGRQCRECVNLSHRKSYKAAQANKSHTPS